MTDRQHQSLVERIGDFFVFSPDGCWDWTGGRTWNDYGRFSYKTKSHRAHRAMYEILVGPIPEGMTLDHLCRNRGCVNPEHLEPVTLGENVLRGVGLTAQNARKTHCVNGHLFDEANTYWGRLGRACRACQHEATRKRRASSSPREGKVS